MAQKRRDLARLLVDRVLPMFGGSPPATHPWWWPLNHGATQGDWLPGVADGEVEEQSGMLRGSLLRSLRQGPNPPKAPSAVDLAPWTAFEGFFGVGPSPSHAIVSVTEAPGTGHYPTAVIATMLTRLGELGLRNAHFTNLVKRRGGTPGTEGLPAHLELLVDELAIVGAGVPRMTICPNRVFSRASDSILVDVRARVAKRIPDTEVTLLLGENAPLALYSGHPQDPAEVLSSWRSVLAR